MSERVKLYCWVIDTPIEEIFWVKVLHNEDWSAVKDEIKEEMKPQFDDIAASTLRLWKVRHCAIGHVVMLNSRRSPSIVTNFIS
jgi:hypothetical protein